MPESPDSVMPPTADQLDLHHFQPREVAPLLDDYLVTAAAAGYRQVLIIHGKGRGVLKRRVLGLLARHPLVRGCRDAPPEVGGWGATVVDLAVPPLPRRLAEAEPEGERRLGAARPGAGAFHGVLSGFLIGVLIGTLIALILLFVHPLP